MAVSGFDLFGGGILKGVQSGYATYISGNLLHNVAINEVNIANSIILVSEAGQGSPTTPSAIKVLGKISNPTMIQFTRKSTGSAIEIFWQVIEFIDGSVDIQKGITNFASGSSVSVPINPVNLVKSILIPSSWNTVSVLPYSNHTILQERFYNNSEIRFSRIQAVTSVDALEIGWQVVEFK